MRPDQYGELTDIEDDDLLLVFDLHDTDGGAQPNGVLKKLTLGSLPSGAAGADNAADIARIFTAGHSYASGYNNTEGGERWATRLASGLHAEEVTYAVTQAVLAQDSGSSQSGGYANVLNALTPRVASGSTYSVRNAAPYLPLAPVAVFNYGFNDLAYLTATTATNVAWYKMALRGCCCIARAGGWFPDTDSSVAYSSGWTANTGVTAYGWPTNHSATATGKTVTITVPADFPGGEIDLLTLTYSGGAKWSTVVDSGSAQVLDGTSSAYGSDSSRANLIVQRLTGLPAGAHTIVMTLSALDSGADAFFQGWLIAATEPPLTVLVNQPAAPCLPLTISGAAHSPVTGSDVTSLNAAIAALGAEFTDGNVVVADIATAFANAGGNVAYTSPGSLYYSDNLHPNALGHGLIAATVRDAIRSAAAPGIARFGPLGLVMRQINGQLEPALSENWSIGGGGYGYFTKDRSGRVTLNAKLVRSGSPSAGEVVLTMPPGYNPEQQIFYMCAAAWASGFASVSPGLLNFAANGQLQWYSGDPTTEFDVFASWPANGLGS